MDTTETILVDYEEHVTTIIIDCPKTLNALSIQILTELNQVLGEAAANNDVYTLVLTGAGEKSFVAGTDIAGMKDKSVEEAAAYGRFSNEVFRKIETFRCPIIAAVDGFALGGGCELVMSYDTRVVSENTVFRQPEAGLGIIPGFSGTQCPVRLAGISIAKEMTYIARNIKAERTYAIGLVNDAVPVEKLMAVVMKMANGIAESAPIAVAYSKKAINNGLQTGIDGEIAVEVEELSSCFTTKDQVHGMTRFLEKMRDEKFSNKQASKFLSLLFP